MALARLHSAFTCSPLRSIDASSSARASAWRCMRNSTVAMRIVKASGCRDRARLARRSAASASRSRFAARQQLTEERMPAAARRARALLPPPVHRSLRTGGQAVPAGRRAPSAAPAFSGSPSAGDIEPGQQRLLRAGRTSRRRPGAARIPASEATSAAPRQTPIPRAACHRSAAARGPGCPTPRRARARCRSNAAADARAVSPSPRMINRPASPSNADSRRGLMSRTWLIGLFGLLATCPGGAQRCRPSQRRFVPVGKSLFQRVHQPYSAFRRRRLLARQAPVQQCRR